MSTPIDWAGYLRGVAAGASLSIVSIMAAPAATVANIVGTRTTRQPSMAPHGYFELEMLLQNRPIYGARHMDPEWDEPTVPEATQNVVPTRLAEELRAISDLPVEMLAQLAGVSRPTYYKWLNGRGITVENVNRLETVLATIRRLRSMRREGLRAFLETATPAGRPLDLLMSGDDHAVVGLALQPHSPLTGPSTISTAAREASGMPSQLHSVRPFALVTRRNRMEWAEAREQLSPTPLHETAAPLDLDVDEDNPAAVAHIHFVE